MFLIYLIQSFFYWPIKKVRGNSLEKYREKLRNAFIFHISGYYDKSNYLLKNEEAHYTNLCIAVNHLKLNNYIECEKKLLNYSKNSNFYKEYLLIYIELAYKRNDKDLVVDLANQLVSFKDKIAYITATHYLYLVKEWEIVLPMLKYCIKKQCNEIFKSYLDITICAILYNNQPNNKNLKLIEEINSLDNKTISLLINIKGINNKYIDYLYNIISKKNNLYISYLFFKNHSIGDDSIFINIIKCLYNNDKLSGLIEIEKLTENNNLVVFISHLFNIEDQKKRIDLWEDYMASKFNFICIKCRSLHSFWLPVCKKCKEIDSYIFNSSFII
ncbi:MAG: hypothetical protein OEY79_01105 [Anaplasmataceae bacterium]|nr:hypothetical protein [Anaplasmataceae bacterium]